MSHLPLVSILIPVYQREAYIGTAIESALRQTYENIEVVVVDNASSDKTWEICQAYALKDPRVKAFRNDTNVGPVGNWKRCIQHATGQFAKILWSDDEIDSIYIEKTLSLLNDSDVGFVFTSTIIGEDFDKTLIPNFRYGKTGRYPSFSAILDFVKGINTPVSPGCAIFRLKDLQDCLVEKIESPSFDDFCEHGAGPDLLIFLLVATRYRYIGFVNEPLSFFREHGGSISISMKKVDLFDRYTQAKLWFSSQFLPADFHSTICTCSWVERLSYSRQFISPSKFREKFGTYVVLPGVWSAGKIIMSKIIKRVIS